MSFATAMMMMNAYQYHKWRKTQAGRPKLRPNFAIIGSMVRNAKIQRKDLDACLHMGQKNFRRRKVSVSSTWLQSAKTFWRTNVSLVSSDASSSTQHWMWLSANLTAPCFKRTPSTQQWEYSKILRVQRLYILTHTQLKPEGYPFSIKSAAGRKKRRKTSEWESLSTFQVSYALNHNEHQSSPSETDSNNWSVFRMDYEIYIRNLFERLAWGCGFPLRIKNHSH